jgi:hypothetical protein
MEIVFSRQISENILTCKISRKAFQWEPSCSTRTDVTKLTVAVCNCANAPKNAYGQSMIPSQGTQQKYVSQFRYFCVSDRLSIGIMVHNLKFDKESDTSEFNTKFSTTYFNLGYNRTTTDSYTYLSQRISSVNF